MDLARGSIESGLAGKELKIEPDRLTPAMKKERGSFVTLAKEGELRGCIGHIEPVLPLWQDVAENARAAAFSDPRFPPLQADELARIALEISVLSALEKLAYGSAQELLEKLGSMKPGVILKQGGRSSTFLPQVWDEIGSAEEFMAHLSLKAGLGPDAWARGAEIETYTVEKISAL